MYILIQRPTQKLTATERGAAPPASTFPTRKRPSAVPRTGVSLSHTPLQELSASNGDSYSGIRVGNELLRREELKPLIKRSFNIQDGEVSGSLIIEAVEIIFGDRAGLCVEIV